MLRTVPRNYRTNKGKKEEMRESREKEKAQVDKLFVFFCFKLLMTRKNREDVT
jgi:hypothetical protein